MIDDQRHRGEEHLKKRGGRGGGRSYQHVMAPHPMVQQGGVQDQLHRDPRIVLAAGPHEVRPRQQQLRSSVSPQRAAPQRGGDRPDVGGRHRRRRSPQPMPNERERDKGEGSETPNPQEMPTKHGHVLMVINHRLPISME
ncbi:hypothetical protein B296_00048293 [Ensete ventricosum]|uniref:Uncharacterized protein n=1 Tax=Ensete ventricosum TaxID=4639 RepID=A0A426XBX6_ENSVE|nr:hypothetical protein B296_00048293 [Ensete ventricosum]